MPARNPSKWNSSKGQEIVTRLDSKEITREEAVKEGLRKLAFDNPVNASRALSQYLNYRSKESREAHGARLKAVKAGKKSSRVSLDPAVVQAKASFQTRQTAWRQLCELLGVDNENQAVPKLREIMSEKEALLRDKTTLLELIGADRLARAGAAKPD